MGTVLTFFLTKGVVYIVTGRFYALFDGNALSEYDSIWFLWSVFAASVALSIAIKISNNKWIEISLILFGFVLVAFFPNAKMNLYLYPYYVIGFTYFSNREKLGIVYRSVKIASIAAFPVLMMFYEKKHYIYLRGGYGFSLTDFVSIDLYRFAIGLAGCLFILNIADLGVKMYEKRHLIRLFDFMEILGKKSLQIYVLSISFLSYYLPIAVRIIVPDIAILISGWTYAFITLLVAIGYSFLLIGIVRFMEKINVSQLFFGR